MRLLEVAELKFRIIKLFVDIHLHLAQTAALPVAETSWSCRVGVLKILDPTMIVHCSEKCYHRTSTRLGCFRQSAKFHGPNSSDRHIIAQCVSSYEEMDYSIYKGVEHHVCRLWRTAVFGGQYTLGGTVGHRRQKTMDKMEMGTGAT